MPRILPNLLPALACLLLAGCRVPVREVAAPVALPGAFSQDGGVAALPQWWKALGSRELAQLVDRALADNFSLKAAAQRIRQADAILRQADAALVPAVDYAATLDARLREDDLGSSSESGGSLGLAAGYEIDLWGRLRAGRNAAALDREASRADLDAARIALAAEVANTWAARREELAQIKLLQGQLETNLQGLEILRLRNRRGLADSIDIAQQAQLVENARGNIELARARLDVADHALAVLAGQTAGSDLGLADKAALPTPGPAPATGVPAEWAASRPDIRAAYLAVQAADQEVAAAIADRFPRISLNARGDSDSATWRSVFDGWVASLALEFAGPLLDAGRRAAEVDRQRARREEALNNWAQVSLEAFAEVENALTREAAQRRYIVSLREQVEQAGIAVDRARANYIRGTETYLRVLDAVRSLQNLERTLLTARRQLLTFRIDLHRALARDLS